MKIIKQGIIYRATEGPCCYQAWPTVCRDENGVLYTAWSGHRSSHVCPFGMDLMSVSTDGGETWDCPRIINDTWMDDRDAGLTYLGNGEMLLSYFHHPKTVYSNEWRGWVLDDPKGKYTKFRNMLEGYLYAYDEMGEEEDTPGSFLKKSYDYGKTWGEAIKVPVSAPHGPVKTKSGRLLYLGKDCPGALSRYRRLEVSDDPVPEEDRGMIFLYESFDGGLSWEKVSKLPITDGKTEGNISEPYIAELPSGELVAAIRAQGKPVYHEFSMYFLNSADGGKTWTQPRSYEISGSPPHLLVRDDGSVIVVYGRRESPCSIRAVVSYDGCRTFGEEMILSDAPNGDMGYPATVELDDGTFVTVYYQLYGDDTRTSILYTKWSL
jgi:hypothetical protein